MCARACVRVSVCARVYTSLSVRCRMTLQTRDWAVRLRLRFVFCFVAERGWNAIGGGMRWGGGRSGWKQLEHSQAK